MRRPLFVVAALATLGGWFVTWWRRHPRFGSATVNRIVNPWLVRRGVPGASHGEIGLIEHVGRRSGTVRVTPVHPIRTAAGYRIIAPVGEQSHWARNVLAAGHCRLQIGERVHELDEPRLVPASAIDTMPRLAARAMDWLGFRYMVLHELNERTGTLEPVAVAQEEPPAPVAIDTEEPAAILA